MADYTLSQTAAQVDTSLGKAHDQQHAITSGSDHTSTATDGQILKADSNGLPVDATNTDTEVSDAVTKKHTQNTDTGTTGTTFQIDSGNSGPKVKNNSNVLEVRNNADDDYLPVKASSFKTASFTLTVDQTKSVSDKQDKLIPFVTQASTDTLTADEVSGTIISNYGQVAANTQTLPTAAEGYNFIAQISTTGAGAFHIKAGPSDYIIFDGTVLDDGDKVSCAAPALGDYITFWTIQTGAAEWQWMASSGNGTWTDGGA
jgi:hypothetical protein